MTAAEPPPAAGGSVARGLLGPELRPLTVSLMSSITLVAYNNLAVTAALPDIGNDLGSVDLLPLVVTAELLAAAIAVLAIGPLVDSIGVRAVYRVSMVGFVAASVLCAVAPAMLVLVGARVAQGLAAGGVIGSTLSSIGLAFEPALRPRMYAAISAVWGVLGVAGPALAAVLISLLGWRWVFLVIVPIGVPAVLIGWSRLPGRRSPPAVGDDREGSAPGTGGDTADAAGTRFDGLGLAVVTVVAVCLLIGASTPSAWAIAYLVAGAIGLLAYLVHARRVADPVVRLEHLAGARWRNIHLTSTLAVGGGTGASAFLPVYLTGARGFSTGAAAFSVLYMVIGWSLAAAVASRLLDHRPPPPVISLGTVLLAAGCAGATLAAGLETPTAVLFACFVVLGSGIGLVTTAGLALLQSRARATEMGRASSAHQFLRSLGFAYGAALAGLVLFLVIGRRIDDVEAIRGLLGDDGAAALSTEARDALQAGYVAALGVMAVVASGAVVSAWRLRRERPVDPAPASVQAPDPDPTPTPGG